MAHPVKKAHMLHSLSKQNVISERKEIIERITGKSHHLVQSFGTGMRNWWQWEVWVIKKEAVALALVKKMWSQYIKYFLGAL